MSADSNAVLTLQCPSCGGKTVFTPGSDRFVCPYCGNEQIFRLPMAAAPRYASDLPLERKRLPRPRPREVMVEQRNHGLLLSWRWFSLKYIPMLFFCIAWDAFLCFWYNIAFRMESTPWIMIVFPIAHVAVGIGLTYSTLAGFVNGTTLHLDSQKFMVQYDPMPWYGEVTVPVNELDQLYCKENRSSSDSGTHYSYQLCALLKDGRKLDLVKNLESPDLAAYLEQQIETWLCIPDREVAGEMISGA
jgi:predicted RNA-binding Zn-ribbon protein involved in translation (DUF1610 family)